MSQSCRHFFLFAFLFSLATSLTASENNAHVENFRFKEYDKVTKALKFLVFGKKGQKNGKEVHLKGVRIVMINDRKPLNIITDACFLDTQEKTCSSQAPIKVSGENIVMTGEGYDLNNKTQEIFIRSKVKMIWKKTPETKKKK